MSNKTNTNSINANRYYLEALTFKDSYKTHIPQIDVAHRSVLQNMTEVLRSIGASNSNSIQSSILLSELVGVLKFHFESEEEFLNEKGLDTETVSHHADHHALVLSKLVEYEQLLIREGMDPLPSIVKYLGRLLVEHFEFEAELFKTQLSNTNKIEKRIDAQEHISMKTILVVEDENLLRENYVDHLESQYFNVLAASNGIEALEVLAQNHVDIVLSDVRMPLMDGLDLLRQIRLTYQRQPKVFIMSGGNNVSLEQFKMLSIDGYFEKPFEIAKLVAAINLIYESKK